MHEYRKERSIMKDFLTIVSGGLGILTAFLGAIGIEAGFIVSVVLCILKLASICAIGWGVVLAPTLIPLGLLIGGFILMGIVHVFLD
jgi:hypothetical protein